MRLKFVSVFGKSAKKINGESQTQTENISNFLGLLPRE
jgi:hypothetical protein